MSKDDKHKPKNTRIDDAVGDMRLDPALLANAEAAVQRLAEDYVGWVNADLDRLEAALSKLRRAGADPKTALDQLFAAAHDIKGQGGTFGYALITQIAGSLCKYLKSQKQSPEIIALHIAALRAILANRLTGDGGAVGQKIAAGLEEAANAAPS